MNNNKIQVEIDITDILGLNEPKKIHLNII